MGARANSRLTSRHASERSRQSSASAFGPISAMEAQPESPIVRSKSARMLQNASRPAFLPGDRETVDVRPSDADGGGAERQGLEDVGTAADPAVEENWRATRDPRDDPGQRVEGRDRAVDLPAAVIGDDRPESSPWSIAATRVVGMQNPFGSNGVGGRGAFTQPGEVAPTQRGPRERGRRPLRRRTRQRRAQVA